MKNERDFFTSHSLCLYSTNNKQTLVALLHLFIFLYQLIRIYDAPIYLHSSPTEGGSGEGPERTETHNSKEKKRIKVAA